MKKVIIILTLFFLSVNCAYAKVINANLDEMISIGLKQNQDIKIKHLELEAAKKIFRLQTGFKIRKFSLTL